MVRYLVLVNPAAGGGRCGARAPAAVERLRGEGLDLEVVHTEAPGHAVELAREAWERGMRSFVAAGGDGTAWEVINGVLPASLDSGERPCLGFLPLGTGNSFLRDFGAADLDHATAALAAGTRRRCDVVRLVHAGGALYYLNLFTLGFAADVALRVNRSLKPLGSAGYAVGVVLETLGLSPSPLPWSADGGPLREEPATFVSFSNSRYTGGSMLMAPGADPSDGLLDVVHAGPLGRIGLLRTFPRIFSGTHLEHPRVDASRARVVELDLDRVVPAMVDGESLELRPLRLEVVPGALDVCA